jgi:iron complex transport system substrate-binding protein
MPPAAFVEKVAVLTARDGIKELPAVAQGRFLNLPYALWTSGPLNIDAAEQVRKALEGWQLIPAPPSRHRSTISRLPDHRLSALGSGDSDRRPGSGDLFRG